MIANTGVLMLDNQLARWYKLIDIPEQLGMVNAIPNGARFVVVPAGRRSGKTERAKRFLCKQALKNSNEKYFVAAPTNQQAKKIFWDDLKKLCLSYTHNKRPSESELKIFMNNGSEVHVIGLDKPERIEGINWTGGVIDEIANVKEIAMESNIMPALNTVDPRRPDYRAWCIFCGVPDGLNHFFRLAEYAKAGTDPDYAYFHWTSDRILPQDVIDSALRTMSPKQYKQEYQASFETASGRIYEDYSADNFTDETIKDHEQLLWYHDFNYTPLSSGIGVLRNKDYYLLEEIILTSAVAKNSAQEFVERYKNHKNKNVIIYGDPAGKAGEKHSQQSDYTDIEKVLRDHNWRFERRVRAKAMSIKDSQNALRAKIKSADNKVSLFVNTKNAPYTNMGLNTVQLKLGSSFLEAESDYQHITTAIRYMMDYEHPVVKPSVKRTRLIT